MDLITLLIDTLTSWWANHGANYMYTVSQYSNLTVSYNHGDYYTLTLLIDTPHGELIMEQSTLFLNTLILR